MHKKKYFFCKPIRLQMFKQHPKERFSKAENILNENYGRSKNILLKLVL